MRAKNDHYRIPRGTGSANKNCREKLLVPTATKIECYVGRFLVSSIIYSARYQAVGKSFEWGDLTDDRYPHFDRGFAGYCSDSRYNSGLLCELIGE